MTKKEISKLKSKMNNDLNSLLRRNRKAIISQLGLKEPKYSEQQLKDKGEK